MQGNRSRLALGDGVLQSLRAEKENQESERARIPGACGRDSTSVRAHVTEGHWQTRI
jgi:hypothetical protein